MKCVISADEQRWRKKLKKENDERRELNNFRFEKMIEDHLARLSSESTAPRERAMRQHIFLWAFGLGLLFATKSLTGKWEWGE